MAVTHDVPSQGLAGRTLSEASHRSTVRAVVQQVENMLRKQFSMMFPQTGGTQQHIQGEDLCWATILTV